MVGAVSSWNKALCTHFVSAAIQVPKVSRLQTQFMSFLVPFFFVQEWSVKSWLAVCQPQRFCAAYKWARKDKRLGLCCLAERLWFKTFFNRYGHVFSLYDTVTYSLHCFLWYHKVWIKIWSFQFSAEFVKLGYSAQKWLFVSKIPPVMLQLLHCSPGKVNRIFPAKTLFLESVWFLYFRMLCFSQNSELTTLILFKTF